MKFMTASAVLIGVAFAAASASSAFAQSGAPGTPSNPTKPKVTAVPPPPPPPPGGPDKYTTRTQPPGHGTGFGERSGPNVVDDIATRPKEPTKSLDFTCRESSCMDLVQKTCDKHGGGMSTNPDGSVTCTIYGPHVMGSYFGPVQPPAPPRPGIGNVTAAPKKPVKSGLEITCSSEWCMKSIVAGCDKNGGGLSSNPDGSVTCSL